MGQDKVDKVDKVTREKNRTKLGSVVKNTRCELFPLRCIPNSQFPIPPFPIPHSPFPIPHSLFPIPHSPFPIPHSPFPSLNIMEMVVVN
ncbi:MAG: hypothetical protein F6K31_23405 [Symploca sp. SIO2G7]|nr:hypothetical protein [Symploca sp. SIO2G7]